MRKQPTAKTRSQRRRFVQSGVKILPALAVLGLGMIASSPARANDCMAGCVGDCTGTCGKKCADSCTSTCEGNCQSTCLGGCSGSSKQSD